MRKLFDLLMRSWILFACLLLLLIYVLTPTWTGKAANGSYESSFRFLSGNSKKEQLMPYQFVQNSLFASFNLFDLNPVTGKLSFPEGVKRVQIDVGTGRSPDLLPRDDDPSLMVISFEPIPSSYWHVRSTVPPHPRWLYLPYAVSQKEGSLTFHVADLPECSSVLPFKEKLVDLEGRPVDRSKWPSHLSQCIQQQRAITVPSIRLETLIRLIPIHRIERLNIDAQGYDYFAFLTTGSEMNRVQTVRLEVKADPNQLSYEGELAKAQVDAEMEKLGFKLSNCHLNTPGWEEYNCDYESQRKIAE
jgi:FkbM family methyltransferase